MGLETLLEAAKFLENESEDAKITQQTGSAVAAGYKQNVNAQKSVPGQIATANSQAYVAQPMPLDSNLSAAYNQNAAIAKDGNNNTFNLEVPAKPRDLIHPANAREVLIPNSDSSKNFKHVHMPVSNAGVVGVEDGKVQPPSNMDPLLARARVAVKNASFGQNEGILIPPPRNISAAGIRGGVVYDQQLLYRHDAAALGLPFALPSQRSSSASDGGRAPVVEGHLKAKADRPVSIVPAMNSNAEEKPLASMIKQIEPNPTMHQNRQLKRNVTLTHNQLEKNRRAHLKECFEALRAAIPRLGMRRASNLTILKAALKQIQGQSMPIERVHFEPVKTNHIIVNRLRGELPIVVDLNNRLANYYKVDGLMTFRVEHVVTQQIHAVVKRKSANHALILSQLKKEQEEKRKRQAALLHELRKTKSNDEIEAFLEVAIRKEVMEMPSISLLDSSQLSTSTASEAEDEEYNETFFRSTQNQSLSSSFRSTPSDIRPTGHHNSVIVAPASAVTAPHVPKAVTTSQALSTAPQYQVPSRRGAISSNPSAEPAVPRVVRSPAVTSQPMRLALPPRPNQDENRVKKSPVRPHPSQPRRSATPTPSSDCLHFFPRFSMGSGGSPPLSASPKFDFYSKKGADKMNDGAKQSTTLPGEDPTGKSVASHAGGRANNFVEAAARPSNAHSDSTKKVADSALDNISSRRRTSVSSPLSIHHQSTTPDTVIVTSFSGYEVKVKYLNQSVTSTAGHSMRMYQDRGPVKKRPLHKALFGSQTLNDSRAPSSRPSSPLGSRGGSELKMTSLYVGASATVLDSLSRKEYSTSTSDHENDGESTFLGHKRKVPSWRRGFTSEFKEASEGKNKAAEKNEKKRPFHLHQYEAPDSNSKAQSEARRKTTFNLWDRKHHAITMTTATNWRGKQQLITSKPKSSSPQARNDVIPIRPISGASLSQVSMSSAKDKTDSVTSSILSAPSFSPRDVAATSLTSSIKSPLSASSQGVVNPVPTATLSTGAVPPGGPRLPQVHALPLQLPGSRIGYQLIQAPAPVQNVAKNPTLPASDVSALNLTSSSLSSVPTLFAPPSYVAVSSAASSDGQKDTTSETSKLMQQTALLAAQSNPLQLGQFPCVFPISYVMYPHGVPHNGVHLAALQPPNGKVLTPNNLTSMQLGMVEQLHPPAKRPSSPNPPPKPPSRNQSNGSASSATLSIDSADADTVKNDADAKKPRIAEVTLPSVINPNSGVMSGPHSRLAQSQFYLPGSSGFMVAAPSAAPTSNGFSLPFNLLSYPVQAFPNPAVQQLALAGVSPAQPLHGIGQGWSFPQAVVPGADSANALVSLSANASRNVVRTSMTRGGKVD